jgi:hypothetical protein
MAMPPIMAITSIAAIISNDVNPAARLLYFFLAQVKNSVVFKYIEISLILI